MDSTKILSTKSNFEFHAQQYNIALPKDVQDGTKLIFTFAKDFYFAERKSI